MSGEKDIKETKEVMVAFLKIAALLAVNFKDGVQAGDMVTIFQKIASDDVLKEALQNAYADIEKVPSEVKDLQVAEVIELLACALPELKDLIKAIV